MIEYADEHQELFPRENVRMDAISRGDRRALVDLWSRALDYLLVLDALMSEHKDFPIERDELQRRRSYLICNAAFVVSYRFVLDFCDRAERNPALEVVFNDPVKAMGLPRNTYGKMRTRFLNPSAAAQFGALRMMRPVLGAEDDLQNLDWFQKDEAAIWQMGKGRGPILSLKSAHRALRGKSFSAWLPVQTRVANWMGETRVTRDRDSLVTVEQIHQLDEHLNPGDLVFERREWVLSNLGIPGFWCHVALYVGTPEERRAFFHNSEIGDWLAAHDAEARDLEHVLETIAPSAYAAQLSRDDSGYPLRMIEALADGVVFTSLEYSASADSVGVLRPRCGKQDLAEAIKRAFVFYGRPYDFNFDFLTDSALVCSEVVYKAFEGALDFPVQRVMGRPITSPNDMVQWYAENGTRELEFVWFLDGYERAHGAFVSTEEEFRRSWTRPKWHAVISRPEDLD